MIDASWAIVRPAGHAGEFGGRGLRAESAGKPVRPGGWGSQTAPKRLQPASIRQARRNADGSREFQCDPAPGQATRQGTRFCATGPKIQRTAARLRLRRRARALAHGSVVASPRSRGPSASFALRRKELGSRLRVNTVRCSCASAFFSTTRRTSPRRNGSRPSRRVQHRHARRQQHDHGRAVVEARHLGEALQ